MSTSPDVLFLVLDSMRKDRVSTYGHDRDTTPTLEELASTATQYENAFAPASWTLPSHCSMFTGLFPSEHGVTNGFADGTNALSPDARTVAEELAGRGYRTAGFSNNPWVGRLAGLDRGFDEFVEWDLEISRSSAAGIHSARDRAYSRLHTVLGQAARQPVFLLKRRFFTGTLVERAKRWLGQSAASSAPTFTFLNLMEAHSPYFPPKTAFRSLGLDPPNPLEPRLLNTKLLAYVMGKRDLDPAERTRVLEYYDASLRYQDRKVGELFSLLKRRDAFEDTLVVVCADHGKTLGEYDRDATPPHYTRNINVNVPLFVKHPGQSAARHEEGVFELAHLYEYILHGATDAPPEASSGVALVEDFLPHSGRRTPEAIDRWRIIADRDYKYVRSDEQEYLFDVGDDSDDLVVDPERELLETYRSTLQERVEALAPDAVGEATDGQELDSAVQSQLRDLGYM